MILRKLLLQEVLFMLSKKKIRAFVKEIDDQIEVRFGEDNFYDPYEYYIQICPENDSLPSFMDHLVKSHKCSWAREFSQITWSILHEIGHYYTDEPDDEEDIWNRVYCGLCDVTDDEYYNLKTEFAATEWAKKFIKNNKEFVRNFEDDLLHNVKARS